MTPQAYGKGLPVTAGKIKKVVPPVHAGAARAVNEKNGTMPALLRPRVVHGQIINSDHLHEKPFRLNRSLCRFMAGCTNSTIFRLQYRIRRSGAAIMFSDEHYRQTMSF